MCLQMTKGPLIDTSISSTKNLLGLGAAVTVSPGYFRSGFRAKRFFKVLGSVHFADF
jgi:hypothetical protein